MKFLTFLKGLRFGPTVESEAKRGAQAAEQLLATSPSDEEVLLQWSSACACEGFGGAESRAYDKAFKAVLRPRWESAKRSTPATQI